MKTKIIKLFDPKTNSSELRNIKSVINSHQWASGAGSPFVNLFEKNFNNYVQSDSSVAVNSGTAALHLALSTLSLKNNEVILPSLSFVSTAHAVTYNGGKIVFSDIDPKTLCMDPNDVKQKITNKTKAIIPVHFGGMPSNLTELKKIAKTYNLTLIEDAAHAAGASFNGKKIGSHGDMVCFSFHPIKNLAMPTGGLISINDTNHKKIRKKLLARRWCGITDKMDVNYNVKEIGWNYYMNEFSAAIGLTQLKKLDSSNNIRSKIAKKYHEKLNLEQKMPYDKFSSYHFYWILVKNRKKFRKKMNEVGIETGIHYQPIHTLSFYKNNKVLPITEKAGREIVTIPTHPNLTTNNVNKIIDSINKFL